jgi:hypothetical protein
MEFFISNEGEIIDSCEEKKKKLIFIVFKFITG